MKSKDVLTVSSKKKEILVQLKKRKRRWHGKGCCIPGCGGASRTSKVFKVPNGKKNRLGLDTKQWSEKFFKVLLNIRNLDNNKFKTKLENGRAYICIDHFKPEDIYYTVHRTRLKHGRLPSIFNQNELIVKDFTQTADRDEVEATPSSTPKFPPFEHVKWDEYLHPTFGKQFFSSTHSIYNLRQENEDFDGDVIEDGNKTIYLQNDVVSNPHTSSFNELTEDQSSDEIIVLPSADPSVLPENMELEENKDILKEDLIDLLFKFNECCERMSHVIKAHPEINHNELISFYKLLAFEVKCLQDKLNKKKCRSSLSVPTQTKQKQYDPQNHDKMVTRSKRGQLPVLMVAEGLGPKFCSQQEYTANIFEKNGWNSSYITSSVPTIERQPNLLKRLKPVFVKTVTVGVPSLRDCEISEKKTVSTENSSSTILIDTNVVCADDDTTSTPSHGAEDEANKDKANQHLSKKRKPQVLCEEKNCKEQPLKTTKQGSQARCMNSTDTTECQLCNKVYLSRNMKQHMAWHDKMHGGQVPTCPCGMKFNNQDNLNLHSMFPPTCNLPKFECKICNEASFTVEDMKEHLLEKHCSCNGSNICEYCANIHNKEIEKHPHVKVLNPYNCIYCEQAYHRPKALFKHVREEHPTSLTFSCENCHKRFRTFYSLTRHKQNNCVAVGKPFLCEYCSKSFRRQAKCRIHIANYHKQTS